MKKIICIILSILMVMSVSATAYANDGTVGCVCTPYIKDSVVQKNVNLNVPEEYSYTTTSMGEKRVVLGTKPNGYVLPWSRAQNLFMEEFMTPEEVNEFKLQWQAGDCYQGAEQYTTLQKKLGNKVISQMGIQNASDIDKVRAIYIYVSSIMSQSSRFRNGIENSINIIYREGLCMSYAAMVQFLCDLAKVDCYTASSMALNHDWNIVKINNKYYHLDAMHGCFLRTKEYLNFGDGKTGYPELVENTPNSVGDKNDSDEYDGMYGDYWDEFKKSHTMATSDFDWDSYAKTKKKAEPLTVPEVSINTDCNGDTRITWKQVKGADYYLVCCMSLKNKEEINGKTCYQISWHGAYNVSATENNINGELFDKFGSPKGDKAYYIVAFDKYGNCSDTTLDYYADAGLVNSKTAWYRTLDSNCYEEISYWTNIYYHFNDNVLAKSETYNDIPSHKYNMIQVVKEATETHMGAELYECENCSQHIMIYTPKIACEHNFILKKKIEPKCVNQGYELWECSRCGTQEKKNATTALGHDWKLVTVKATTKASGKKYKECTRCGIIKDGSESTISQIKTVSLSTTKYTYNGKVKNPAVTVTAKSGRVLVKDTDYTVTYPKGRTKVGKYTVTITFKGNYKGTVKKTFTIVPKGTSISSITALKKGFKVTWKKQATQTTGYQIQYSTSSKFSKPKTITFTKNSTTSKQVSKLSARKKYYVRVRTFKTVNGTKYYSAWSKSRSVTTK